MSTSLAKGSVTVVSHPHLSQMQLPTGPAVKPSTPDPAVLPMIENGPPAGAPRPVRGQLTQFKFEPASIRKTREVASESDAHAPDAERKTVVYPALAQAKKADSSLQKTLTHLLTTHKLNADPFPPGASIRPFIDAYTEAVNEPQVQAWLTSKGLDLSTALVFSDRVEGTVVVDGKTVARTFTTTDGSGWWEVSAKVCAAVKQLKPSDMGVLLPGQHTVKFRDFNAVLEFYGVEYPAPQIDAKALGKRLKKHGWPPISDQHRDQWRRQYEQLMQHNSDIDVRTHLTSQLRGLVKDRGEGDTPTLSAQYATVYPESTLAHKSHAPRERFVEWLGRPAFKAFIERSGLGGAESVYRISNGSLEIRDSANQWISVQVILDQEIYNVSIGGSPAEKAAIHALNNDLHQLVEMSKATGNALYSQAVYDVRQVLAFSGLGSPETVTQINSAISWLTAKLPPAPTRGDYARLSPYTWAPGALSPADLNVVKAASSGPGSVSELFASHMARTNLPRDPDLQLQQFFDSHEAIIKAQALAQQLNMAEVTGGKQLSKATRHQLLAATIKASVNAQMPGKPGMVAGYDIYQPNNLGRTLDEVRADIEGLLRKKGADVNTAPLIAHMMLAQAAPEFLIKPDPGLSPQAPEALKLSPGQVSVGSTAWMSLRLGCAMAEKLSGAGSSRALNISEAQALTRLEPMGPEHETLIKCLGAAPLLDWAVMAGVFPKTSDGAYSAGDYRAAAQAFADRQSSTVAAFQSLTSEPPSQTSLLIDQLVLLFPEMTRDEIAKIKLTLVTDKPYDARNEGHLETRTPLLTELILAGEPEEDPFFVAQQWVNTRLFGEKKYAFTHPTISQETFEERIKKLPRIKPLVAPAVDQYLADSRRAQETVIKLMIANAPLDVRTGLESGDVEIFTLREETGESLAQDQGSDSKVVEKRAKQGVLLRYKNKGPEGGYTCLEMFPGSMKVCKRNLLFSTLKLDGVIEEGTVPYGPFANVPADYRKATQVDFDLQAYQTGSELRPGVRTKAIIEKFGETLPGQSSSRWASSTPGAVPNSWASKKTNDIARAIVNATFDVKRETLLEYANAPTTLQRRRSYPFDSGKVFTRENLRMVLSLIPFVGAIADIADGNIGAGLKGLVIDFASFAFTGGLRGFFSGFKTVVPFGSRAFTMTALKGGSKMLRGLFNPLDGVFDVFRIGPKALGAARQVLRGELVCVGPGFFLTTTAFEKCRWGLGAYDALAPRQASGAYPGSQLGVSRSCPTYAVQIDTKWYAIDPVTQTPTGAPIEDFKPDAPVN